MEPNELVYMLVEKTRARKIKWTYGGTDDRFSSGNAEDWQSTHIGTLRLQLSRKTDPGDRPYEGPSTRYELSVHDADGGGIRQWTNVAADQSKLQALWNDIEQQPKDDLIAKLERVVKSL